MYPIFFSIGPIAIYSFGTLIAVGYLLAGLLLFRDARRKGENPILLLDLGIGLLLTALIGGRILYILLHLDFYLEDPWEILRIYRGGLVFYGGFVAAVGFAIFFIQRKKLPLWKTLDRMVPYVVLVHAFGRIGCFLNGCCYGKVTSLWVGVHFPGKDEPLHPTQLYESSFLFLLFFILRTLSERAPRPGTLFLGYLFSYGIFRFFIETLRGDQELFLGNWTLPQVLSVLVVGISLFLWAGRRTG